MAQIRYYTVEQTREVKVTANNAIDAARIGDNAFACYPKDDSTKQDLSDIWGNAITPVNIREISVREDY